MYVCGKIDEVVRCRFVEVRLALFPIGVLGYLFPSISVVQEHEQIVEREPFVKDVQIPNATVRRIWSS